MVFVMLSKYDSGPINKKIIEWCRNNLQKNNIEYRIVFCKPYITDNDVLEIVDYCGIIDYNTFQIPQYMIDEEWSEEKISEFYKSRYERTYILWNPLVASRNLSYVMELPNSIVILENQTYLNQKISEKNPFNENLAVNYCVYIMYLNEIEQVTKEFRIAVQKENYIMTQNYFMNMLKNNPENFRKEKQNIQDVFDDSTILIKNQVNIE